MLDLNANELEMLNYWREKDVLGRLRARNKGKKPFYFLDGPPYVSGDLHPGQMWVKAVKDITLRYRRMRGYDVRDMPGYDVHGLPIENKVEKKLELKSKQEIEEKIGVEEFIRQCRKFVDDGIGRMDSDYERFGITLDFAHPYIPFNKSYIEAGWQMFKRISDRGLLYRDTKATLYCPRCQTPVSQGSMEAEYMQDNDPSIAVSFKVVKNSSRARISLADGEYSLLIWTTTPWTLPSNIAIAVNPKELYVLAKFGSNNLIVAKKRLDDVVAMLNESAIAIEEFYGSELEGMEYANPLEQFVPKQKELRKYHKVVASGELVTMDDGTGLVHIAPGHGLDDYNLGKKLGLPIFSPVAGNAEYTEDAGKYVHLKVPEEANKAVMDDLKSLGVLLYKGSITHSYPHCWRCDSKLIFIATPQWFFNVAKVKSKVLSENGKVIWHPKEAQQWQADVLRNSPDWCISRQRYWGIPIPIWECEKCGEIKVIGSLEELASAAIENEKARKLEDLHRPYIDEIKIKCHKCGSTMHRVKDVTDVWFDSSIAFRASIDSEKEFERLFPVDYIIEGKDQLRGWFSGLIKISVLAYGKKPFKNVGVDGMLLDESGREMHKKLGNYVALPELLKITSADVFRIWSTGHTPWLDLSFNRSEIRDSERTINVLYNAANLIEEYGKLTGIKPKWTLPKTEGLENEERWLISRMQSLIISVTDALENYEAQNAVTAIREFIGEDFSRFYLKVAKKKLLNSDKAVQKKVMQVVSYALDTVLTLASPIIPFTSDYITLRMLKNTDDSISMRKWPKAKPELIDKELESSFDMVKESISALLNNREQAKVPLRWPVKQALVETTSDEVYNVLSRFSGIVGDYANAKEVLIKKVSNVGLEAKPQFQKIGPEFKDNASAVAKAITEANIEEMKRSFETGGSFALHTEKGVFEIRPEHVVISEFNTSEGMKKFKYGYAKVDSEISKELENEAFIRELERRIQMERKSEGMKRSDKVEVYINADDETASLIKKDVSQFAKDINAKKVEIVNDFESGLKAIPLEIMETQLRVAIKKIGV
ncbi:MAG: isoleucine--tRNA ligase [Candidatus Marsarchaeota archaeon]|nr:isoleucine--tRNA ligase [Candidatus Marsarchaeota archaeon]